MTRYIYVCMCVSKCTRSRVSMLCVFVMDMGKRQCGEWTYTMNECVDVMDIVKRVFCKYKES